MRLNKLFVLYALLFTASFYGPAFASPESCSESINDLFVEIASYTKNNETSKLLTLPIVAYSGKNLNDFGSYRLCKESPKTSYVTLELELYGTSFALGLCGPPNCTAADYKDSRVQKRIEFLLYLAGIQSNYNISRILTNVNISVHDPDGSPAKTTSTYITFAVTGVLLVLLAAGTIYAHTETKYEKDPPSSYSHINRSSILSSATDASESYVVFQDAPPASESLSAKILKCWAVQDNFNDLIKPPRSEKHDSNLDILNGARVLSIMWVMLGHEYGFRLLYTSNYATILSLKSDLFINFVHAGFYSVDTFFFLGGLLSTYVLTSKLKHHRPSAKTYFGIVFHRVIRILPTYSVSELK